MKRYFPLLALTGILLVVALGLAVPAAQAVGTEVFINEIHYDNTGTDTGEAIEIAGPAGTDLTGWSIVLYNGNGGATYDTRSLSGTIPDLGSGYGTVVENYPVNGIQNGSPDGIALVDGSGASDVVVQFLCYEGTFVAVGGPADGLTCEDIGVAEGSSTPIGDSLQLTGSGTTYEDFVWTGPIAKTFGAVNTGQSFGGVANAPVVLDCGSILRTYETAAVSQVVTASDADGIVSSMSISDITPALASGSISLVNFVPAANVGGTASANVVVDADVPAGEYTVTVTATNNDTEPQEGTCNLPVDVDPFLTIGEVQGVVTDDNDYAQYFRSPYAPPSGNGSGEYVAIQGVIYQKVQSFNSYGGAYYGFFIQNTADTSDGDPLTSDGIYVYHSYFSTLRVDGGGYYFPEVGDEVILRGPVSEYYSLTEMVSPYVMEVVNTGLDVDTLLPPFEANPPDDVISPTDYDDIDDANRYWERREGMRAQVPAGSIVLNGRDVFASTYDAEVWVARDDTIIAQRIEDYARRSFRDPHPLDDIPQVLFDNDNPYRILMGSLGLKETFDDTTAMLAPVGTFDTLTNAPIGGVYYSFSKYQIQPGQQLEWTDGIDASANGAPMPLDREMEYSIVTFNVENLYDFYDDPFDGCDFAGNSGCPGVYPPFDYVPASDEVYQARLAEIAEQIKVDLHSPDIIMAQEAEDQDVCTIDGTDYVCPDPGDAVNNADGKPDTLQELAAKIYAMGGPMYATAFDRDGADDRGIISGYLYRTDRVELLPAMANDPVLGPGPYGDAPDHEWAYYPYSEALPYNADVQNPKALNAVLPDFVTGNTDGDNVFTRPPQVGLFRVWRDEIGTTVFQDIYLSDNHFSSGPDNRVDQRTEQAAYNAAIVEALQDTYPGVYVSVGGDLNVYPRPDDPFPPPNESDQLAALYEVPMTNLWDILVDEDPDSAYGYIYQGQAQTLDQIFTAAPMLTDLLDVKSAHINSDFPADYAGDGPRGTSDHDPLVAAYALVPTLDRLEELVNYYDSIGEITGNKTTKILLDRLERARDAQLKGKQQDYESMLKTFALQVQGFAPRQISQEAADALEQEALLLLSMSQSNSGLQIHRSAKTD